MGTDGLAKEEARAELRRRVIAEMGPLVDAQIANAKGIKYLVAREVKSGKFIEVTEAQVKDILAGKNDTLEMLEVWEKQPSVQAFTDLMNRTIDKPVEQVNLDANVNVGSAVIERLTAGRKRVASVRGR